MKDQLDSPATSPDRLAYAACPLCTSRELEDFHTGDCSKHPLYHPKLSKQMRWKHCTDCDHVFTDGYFTDAAAKLVFSKTHAHQKIGHDMERNRPIAARMIDKVTPYRSSGTWLDVGFGNGALLFAAQEYGFDPVGVDLRRDNVTLAQKLGLTAHCEDVTKLELSQPCAVISLMDVLEHVPHPREFMAAIHRLLEPGGVVFMSMPNSGTMVWDYLTAQNANPYWGELEHYHNFSRARLYALLREFGFEPKRYGVSERYRVCMEVVAVKL